MTTKTLGDALKQWISAVRMHNEINILTFYKDARLHVHSLHVHSLHVVRGEDI